MLQWTNAVSVRSHWTVRKLFLGLDGNSRKEQPYTLWKARNWKTQSYLHLLFSASELLLPGTSFLASYFEVQSHMTLNKPTIRSMAETCSRFSCCTVATPFAFLPEGLKLMLKNMKLKEPSSFEKVSQYYTKSGFDTLTCLKARNVQICYACKHKHIVHVTTKQFWHSE